MLSDRHSGAIRGALLLCVICCCLFLSPISAAFADHEYRARVTVTNHTGADLLFDVEKSYANSPSWWLGWTNTAVYDEHYIQRTIYDGQSRTISAFGGGDYLELKLVVRSVAKWCGCRAVVTARVAQPEGEGPPGGLEVSPGPFAGKVEFKAKTKDPFPQRSDTSGTPKERHLIHRVKGEVVLEKGSTSCCPEVGKTFR